MVFTGFNHTKTAMARSAPRVTTASLLAFVVVAASGSMVSSTRAQEAERPTGLFDRIFSGSDRGAPAGAERTAQMSGSDLMLRLDRLESQIRQLTGVIEQLQFRNQQLEGQLRRLQEDTDYRFQESNAKGPARPALQSRPQNPPPQPSGPATTGAPGRRGEAFDPTQNPNAPGAPHTLGSINPAGAPAPMSAPMSSPMSPSMGADAGDEPIGAPGGRGAGAPLDLATMGPPGSAPGQPVRNSNAGGAMVATLPPSQTPRDEYDLAYGYVLRKDYVLAEEGFRSFLSRYPGDRLTGDATYWLGESLFQRQRFRDAAESFLTVSTKYEGTAKAPDALLRLGQSLAALGEKEAACASLGEVLRKFPRASAGVKQGVEREQKRVRC
jgi:tol-pal system protein YbgF